MIGTWLLLIAILIAVAAACTEPGRRAREWEDLHWAEEFVRSLRRPARPRPTLILSFPDEQSMLARAAELQAFAEAGTVAPDDVAFVYALAARLGLRRELPGRVR